MSIDDYVTKIREIVPELTNIVTGRVRINLMLVFKGEEPTFNENQLKFLCGYAVGFSDVMAQVSGAKSGGSLAQTLTSSVLYELFGQELGENLYSLAAHYMSSANRPVEFHSGMTGGAEDANELFDGKPTHGVGRNLASFFLEEKA